MADPLTTFAAAGNTLQFVLLGVQLLRKTVDYANNDGSSEFYSLRDLCARLRASCEHLRSSMGTAASSACSPGPARALHLANMECIRLVSEFLNILDKLKLNKPATVWNSVKLACKHLNAKSEIGALQKGVENARSNLMLCLLVCLQHESRHRDAKPEFQTGTIIGEIQKSTKSSARFIADVEKLTQKLASCVLRDYEIKAKINETLEKNQFSLKSLTENTKAALEDLNSEIKSISSDAAFLSSIMDCEVIGRRKVRESLYFSKMNQRRDNVRRAHQDTYTWIYKRAENKKLVCDNFMSWLEGNVQRTYWISGKPGSGKTTLMRELDEFALANIEDGGLAEKPYLKASCYFWHAGSAEEKSVQGLLKSLVYQLFQQRPDLIDKTIHPDRWTSALRADAQMIAWNLEELVAALTAIAVQTIDNARLILFIDGLDELDGPDQDRDMLLGLITSISQHQNVKVCAASRPWPVFTLAFKSCPQLRLEDLTKDDIRKFVHDKLNSNELFCQEQQRTPALLEGISSKILDKAQGVFLWVYLVVRDLLNVLRDGGSARHLLQELESIPPDLHDYFKRMMASIANKYRNEASTILQIALHSMDFSDDHTREIQSSPDFLLGHLEFIDQADDASFATKPQAAVSDFSSTLYVYRLFELLDRRLASRSMGLLESSRGDSAARKDGWKGKPWKIRIDFLHRTAREYFLTPPGQSLLRQYASLPVNAHIFRMNLLVINTDIWKTWPCPNLHLESAACFFHHIHVGQPSSDAVYGLFEKLVSNLESNSHNLCRNVATDSIGKEGNTMRFCEVLLKNWGYNQHTPMTIAILVGWKPYIQSRLTSSNLERPSGKELLSYAFDANGIGPHYPDHSLVETVLQSIARVDTTADTGVRVDAWLDFMLAMQYNTNLQYSACLKTIQVLIRYRFRQRVRKQDLQNALGNLASKRDWFAWIEAAQGQDLRIFSIVDVARTLTPIREGKLTGDTLIAQEDIEGLQALMKECEVQAALTEHQQGSFKRRYQTSQPSEQSSYRQHRPEHSFKRMKTKAELSSDPRDYSILNSHTQLALGWDERNPPTHLSNTPKTLRAPLE